MRGSERQTLLLARELSRRGHEVVVACRPADAPPRAFHAVYVNTPELCVVFDAVLEFSRTPVRLAPNVVEITRRVKSTLHAQSHVPHDAFVVGAAGGPEPLLKHTSVSTTGTASYALLSARNAEYFRRRDRCGTPS